MGCSHDFTLLPCCVYSVYALETFYMSNEKQLTLSEEIIRLQNSQNLRLLMGELSKQEMRTAKALLAYLLRFDTRNLIHKMTNDEMGPKNERHPE